MDTNEPLIINLQVFIHWSVRVLAILMLLVIVMSSMWDGRYIKTD